MRPRSRCRPGGEGLEARISPVGFYEGPAPVPVQLFLQGAARGTARVQALAGGAVITLAASGRVSPLGLTKITGTLRQTGGFEQGTLRLNSAKHSETLHVVGPVPQGPNSFSFQIVQGQGVAPNTTYSFEREFGGGTVVIALSSGMGRGLIGLTFSKCALIEPVQALGYTGD